MKEDGEKKRKEGGREGELEAYNRVLTAGMTAIWLRHKTAVQRLTQTYPRTTNCFKRTSKWCQRE